MDNKKKEIAYKILRKVDGKAGEDVENSLNDTFPDLVNYMIEYVWGEVYPRETLDLKSKEISVVSALTALGTAVPQLKVHINGALNVGCTINEIKEIILQMSAYSGFPSCINGINALQDVLNNRKKQGITDSVGSEPSNAYPKIDEERYEFGLKELAELDSKQIDILKEAYEEFFPDLVKFIVYGQADILSRNNLNKRYREIATVAALTALGNAPSQLRFHINAALNVGIDKEEIKEIMLLMSVYAGFPAAINGTNALIDILEKNNK